MSSLNHPHICTLFDAGREGVDGGFRQGEPRQLFELPAGGQLVDVTADLDRFLVIESEVQSNPAPLCILTSRPQRLETAARSR